MLADSPGDPARFSFCSVAHIHFPDSPPPPPPPPHSPSPSHASSSLERQLLAAWSSAAVAAAAGACSNDTDRLHQFAAFENQRSVNNLKEIESRQRRLEELELAMDAFCADLSAANSTLSVPTPTLTPRASSVAVAAVAAAAAAAAPLRIDIKKVHRVEYVDNDENLASARSSTLTTSAASDENEHAVAVPVAVAVVEAKEAAQQSRRSRSHSINDPLPRTRSRALSLNSHVAPARPSTFVAAGHARKVSLGTKESLHWHSSHRSRVYEPVPPSPKVSTPVAAAAPPAVRLVSAEQLDQIDFEYSDLMHTPVPPQRTNVPPPTPTGVSSSDDDDDGDNIDDVDSDIASSITVKKFHLPATGSKYMESLLMQINDPEVKMRLRIINDDRVNAANNNNANLHAESRKAESQLSSASTLATATPVSAPIEHVHVLAKEEEQAPLVPATQILSPVDVVKSPVTSPKQVVSPSSVVIPPRRHLHKQAAELAEKAEQSAAASAPVAATAQLQKSTPRDIPAPPALIPTTEPMLTPPTRRSSMLPGAAAAAAAALEAAAADAQMPKPVPLAVPATKTAPVITVTRSSLRAMPPRLYIPPPPSTPPPTLLTRMGVFQTTPIAVHRPYNTLGRRWGDPMNSTSFITPPHVAPEKTTVPIERVSEPTLLNTSWRGPTVPIEDVLRELSSSGRFEASNGSAKAGGGSGGGEYRHGWGSLKTVLRPKKSRPDLASVMFEAPSPTGANGNGIRIPITPTSPAQRSATVYPSPPSSPPKPRRGGDRHQAAAAAAADAAVPAPALTSLTSSSPRATTVATTAPPPRRTAVSRGFGSLARKMGFVLRPPTERIPATIPEEEAITSNTSTTNPKNTTTTTTSTDYLSTRLGSVIPSPGTWDFVPPPMQQDAASSYSPPRRLAAITAGNSRGKQSNNNNRTTGRFQPPSSPKQTTLRAKNRSSEMEEFRMMLLETYGTTTHNNGGRGGAVDMQAM
ncbi:hypothetical protein HDU86_000290 [Geranomyces michiganensis]|nr:hypothetical protein HDU86_000290 [Geranomyces michiganensis]